MNPNSIWLLRLEALLQRLGLLRLRERVFAWRMRRYFRDVERRAADDALRDRLAAARKRERGGDQWN
jgi:hypothetical protein